MGSIARWQPAQPGLARCCSRAARRLKLWLPLVVASRGGTSGGRRRRRAQQIFEHAFSALHDRRAIGRRGHRQQAGLLQQTSAVRILKNHPAELRTIDVRNTVVLGQPFVEERIIRRQQIESTCGFPVRCFQKTTQFPAACSSGGSRQNWRKLPGRVSPSPDYEYRATARRNSLPERSIWGRPASSRPAV